MIGEVRLILGDAGEVLKTLPDESVDCVLTSPPYWGLRDYGVPGQIGQEPTWEEYVDRLVGVFREVRRVLRRPGSLWVNLGDCYAHPKRGGAWDEGRSQAGVGRVVYVRQANRGPDVSLPRKCLVGLPWRLALALVADGWILRGDIIWHKLNTLPESVRDRFARRHEYLFHLVKAERYYFDLDAVREPHQSRREPRRTVAEQIRFDLEAVRKEDDGSQKWDRVPGQRMQSLKRWRGHHGDNPAAFHPLGRNPGTVWPISCQPHQEAHFAVFPEALCERPILASCPPGGWVLDPFCGIGTTLVVARRLGRHAIGIDVCPQYLEIARKRVAEACAPMPPSKDGERDAPCPDVTPCENPGTSGA